MAWVLSAAAIVIGPLSGVRPARADIVSNPNPIVIPANTGATLTAADNTLILSISTSFYYTACPPYCPPEWDVSDATVTVGGDLEVDPPADGSTASLAPGSAIGPAQPCLDENFFYEVENEPEEIAILGNFHGGLVGFAFSDAGQEHYGWAEIDLGAKAAVTVNGYAYESCPNAPISGGLASGGASCGDSPAPESGTLQLAALGLLALFAGCRKVKARAARG
ncbi:MAG: hypothetical protein ACRD3D_18260 [Terriglobia bacterium]